MNKMPSPIRETADQKHCVVRPKDVPLHGDCTALSTFGLAEREQTAGRLVLFFKHKGMWCAFTIDELQEYYLSKGWGTKGMLYGLYGKYTHWAGGVESYDCGETLIAKDGACYAVTDHFIERCMSGVASGA